MPVQHFETAVSQAPTSPTPDAPCSFCLPPPSDFQKTKLQCEPFLLQSLTYALYDLLVLQQVEVAGLA